MSPATPLFFLFFHVDFSAASMLHKKSSAFMTFAAEASSARVLLQSYSKSASFEESLIEREDIRDGIS
jgi:hypothetical protein